MTNAAFAFMCIAVLALLGVCVAASDTWPIASTAVATITAFVVYAKDW